MAVTFSISVSLDGFVAGPDPSPDDPLGKGGEELHEWALGSAAWRASHGKEGGEENADSEIVQETIDSAGAHVMGRRMFGGGEGEWDESWQGWWGDEPPFRVPVFVLTHHPREPLTLGATTFTFVTDGIESALEQAKAAAGERDVHIAGGASVAQQYLEAGLLDTFEVHVAPVLLGGGTRLFEGLSPAELEIDRVVGSPEVAHLRYRVAAP